MVKLTDSERTVLRDAEVYGPAIDFGGHGAKATFRNAAKHLIEIGFLSGEYRNCRITDAGRTALADGGAK